MESEREHEIILDMNRIESHGINHGDSIVRMVPKGRGASMHNGPARCDPGCAEMAT